MSHVIVCLKCERIYNHVVRYGKTKEVLWKEPYICPNCSSNMILLDESIAQVIIILNKKGYTTNFCCSGHICNRYYREDYTRKVSEDEEWNYTTCYIAFANTVDCLPSIPKKFQVEINADYYDNTKQTVTIRRVIDKKGAKKARLLLETSLILLEWAESLNKKEHKK